MRSTPALDARAGLVKLATFPYQVLTWVDDAGYPVSVAVETRIDSTDLSAVKLRSQALKVGGLQLRSMQSLGSSVVGAAPAQGATQGSQATPAAPTFQAAAQAANATAPKPSGVLYRHGVELTVEGSYAEVLAYLRAIEAMPQRVLWGGMQLRVEQHPKVIVSLQLFTLSQDRTWLEI